MRKFITCWMLLAALAVLLPIPAIGLETQTYTEDFSTTTYMDAANTTAHWDTFSNLLKLPPIGPYRLAAIGVHDWITFCRWEKPFEGCIWPEAPAAYVPETGKAYQLASHIVEYDPQRNVSFDLPYSGPLLHDFSSAAAYVPSLGKVYVFGGADGCQWGGCLPQKHIYEFDPFARTTTLLSAQLPVGLADAVAAYVPSTNKIYLLGGRTPDGPTAQVLVFDVATHSLLILGTQLPSPRKDVCGALVPGSDLVYLFGGDMSPGGLDEILSFDPSTGQVSLLEARLPTALYRATAAYVPHAGRVFIFGGEQQGAGALKSVFAFDVATGTIATAAYQLPGDGLWDASAFYAPESDSLALLGGRGFGRWPYKGIVRLRCSGSSLTPGDSFLPWKTHTHSAVYVPKQNNVYLFGGDSAEILQFETNAGLVHTMSAALPVASSDPGAVWIPTVERAYIFDASGIYAYDPDVDALHTLSASLPAGFDARVAIYAPSRDAVYLFDSADGGGSILKYDVSDGSLAAVASALPSPRRSAYGAYVPATNTIYLFGGWGYGEGAYLDRVLAFNVGSETITTLGGPRLSIPGDFKAAAHLPGTADIYLLGGWGGWSELYSFGFDETQRFRVPANSMSTVPPTLPLALGRQAIALASAENRFYTFGGLKKVGSIDRESTDWIHRIDGGLEEQGTAQSTRINGDNSNVLRATLTAVQQLNGGSVEYFLSNDGGATWEAVTPGEDHVFTSQGCDLRWRAVLQGDGMDTPAVDQLTIDSTAAGLTLTLPSDGSHTCETSPDFDWSDVDGATSYDIQVDDDAAFASPVIEATLTSSSHTPSELLSPGTYHWRARATTSCGDGAWSAVWSFTVDTAPATPSGPSPADGAAGVSIDANLGWADAAAAASYDVYFGTSSTPSYVASVTSGAYNLPTLSGATDYYWRIVAKNSCGDTSGPVWHFTTGAMNHPPENLTVWPSSGGRPVGKRVNFASTFRDRDGWRDLKQVFLHVGSTTGKRNNCRVMYDVRRNRLHLLDNAGTTWIGGYVPGSAHLIRNRQCTLNCAKTSVTRSGRLVKVKWNLLFRPAFRGTKRLYLRCSDRRGGLAPWQNKGTWTVR